MLPIRHRSSDCSPRRACLAAALPSIAADPTDRAGRSLALRGTWLCGVCLGATTMSLHHKLCHVLGGTFDLPHARTHAVILPYGAAFNLPAAPSARVALCRALRTDDPAGVLTDLAAAVGAHSPTSGQRGPPGRSASGPSRGRQRGLARRCRTAPPLHRPWNPHHLVDQPPRPRHMLSDVRRQADVDAAVGEEAYMSSPSRRA